MIKETNSLITQKKRMSTIERQNWRKNDTKTKF